MGKPGRRQAWKPLRSSNRNRGESECPEQRNEGSQRWSSCWRRSHRSRWSRSRPRRSRRATPSSPSTTRSSRRRTIKKANLTMSPPPGVFKGGIDLDTGKLQGSIKLPNTTFTQSEAGVGLVTATAAMVQTKPVTGTVDLGHLQGHRDLDVQHPDPHVVPRGPDPPAPASPAAADPASQSRRELVHDGNAGERDDERDRAPRIARRSSAGRSRSRTSSRAS